MDNPYTRERLELLVNQMTLKQNGGNTLFLKNYEPGPTYVKDITHITKDNQTIKKHIKISSCTKAGCKGPGIVKTNQDAFFIKENFLKNNEYFYIGVCDGHGEFGHVVSNFVINKLPAYIKDLSNESITSAFKKVNKEIYGNTKLDSSMSGTTVVSIVLTPNNIQCVNLGDSRAALFKYDNGIYYCKNLSRDHKPAEADEARRIDLSGGRIKRCYDEDHKRFVGPDRVWMKNKDEPGLAMTRSLGDKIAHNIGVSDEPEFAYDPQGLTTLRGHLANVNVGTMALARTHGAPRIYHVVGASNAEIPMTQISTYLAAGFMRRFVQMIGREKINASITKQVVNEWAHKLNLVPNMILGRISNGANGVQLPDVDKHHSIADQQ